MRTLKSFGTLALMVGLLGLSACGWHLRGAQPIPEELKTLHLSVPGEYAQLKRTLKRSLRTFGVNVQEQAGDAPLSLEVIELDNHRRTVSTSSRGKDAEYELTTYLTYQLKDKQGTVLLGPETISTERIYLFDPNRVASSSEEERLLRAEMQEALIQILIRRYQATRTQVQTES